jgi:hypothetical protein
VLASISNAQATLLVGATTVTVTGAGWLGRRVGRKVERRQQEHATVEATTRQQAADSYTMLVGAPAGGGRPKTVGVLDEIDALKEFRERIEREFDPNRRDSMISKVTETAAATGRIERMIANGNGNGAH